MNTSSAVAATVDEGGGDIVSLCKAMILNGGQLLNDGVAESDLFIAVAPARYPGSDPAASRFYEAACRKAKAPGGTPVIIALDLGLPRWGGKRGYTVRYSDGACLPVRKDPVKGFVLFVVDVGALGEHIYGLLRAGTRLSPTEEARRRNYDRVIYVIDDVGVATTTLTVQQLESACQRSYWFPRY